MPLRRTSPSALRASMTCGDFRDVLVCFGCVLCGHFLDLGGRRYEHFRDDVSDKLKSSTTCHGRCCEFIGVTGHQQNFLPRLHAPGSPESGLKWVVETGSMDIQSVQAREHR